MYTRDGIIKNVSQGSGRKYLIHIQTGEKVEIYKRLKDTIDRSKVSFIRTQIYPEEITKIREEMGITISERKLSMEEELVILKKMAKAYKKFFSDDKNVQVTFMFDSKEIVI